MPAERSAAIDDVLSPLIDSLRWRSTVFHVGQYCGAWQGSTAGHQQASFHFVLQGEAWLHRPSHDALRLRAGDAVFFCRDEPHQMSSAQHGRDACRPRPMQPSWPLQADGTALACGFFETDGALSQWLLASLPGPLFLRADADGADAAAARAVFALMRDEADRSTQRSTDAPSAAMARLVDLLLLYVLRHAVSLHTLGPLAGLRGLWALATHRDLAALLQRLLADPAADWSTERMAEVVHLSRAAFFRRFQQATGEAPAQFLVRLRMVLAAERLRRGDSVERAAEQAGYQSPSAFHRAFVRVMGAQPGRVRRDAAGSDALQ